MRRAGKSYREISSELGVAKSTLSNWFKGVDFSEAIKDELTKQAAKKSSRHIQSLNRTRGIALKIQYELAEKEALKEMRLYRNVPLFTTAVAAYWGEGDKATRGMVRLANADPKMLTLFIKFLTEICHVPPDRIKGALYLYPDLDERTCKRYWTKQTGLKTYHKTQVLPIRSKTSRLPYGTCAVLVSNTYLKKKLLFWIDQLPEMVLNTVPKRKR